MRTFWLAICLDCTPTLPTPFDNSAERDEWAAAHTGAFGHRILTGTEHRP